MNDSTKCLKVAKIVPVPNQMRTLGTRVYLDDGSELESVQSVQVNAVAGDCWEAVITLKVYLDNVGEMEVKTL